MSVIYLLALVAVGLAIAALTLESVLSVSRKPRWAHPIAGPSLRVVATADRRQHDLPFVGPDRRQSAVAAGAESEDVRSNRAA